MCKTSLYVIMKINMIFSLGFFFFATIKDKRVILSLYIRLNKIFKIFKPKIQTFLH